MEDQLTLQDEYEASRSSAIHASGLVSPTRSKSFSFSEDERAGPSGAPPSSNRLLPLMAGYHALLRSDIPNLADSRQSQDHQSGRQNRASFIRSTSENGNTGGKMRKDKKGTSKKTFTMDDLILGPIHMKRARPYSASLSSLIIGGKDRQTTSTTSTDSTVSYGKPIKGSRNISKTNSLTAVPAPRHQIPFRPSSTLKLPTGPFLTPYHRLLKMKLTPLAALESQLLDELSTPAMGEDGTRCSCLLGQLRDQKELIIRPLRGWEDKFGRLRIGTPRWLKEESKVRSPDDPSHVISAW